MSGWHYDAFLAGSDVSTRERLTVTSPWDGSVVGDVGLASVAELDRAAELAVGARGRLAALSRDERAHICDRAAERVEQQREGLADLIVAETGKPIRYAEIEVLRAADTLRASARAARALAGDEVPLDAAGPGRGRLAFTRWFPVGAVAAIAPWNFPLNLVAHKLGPAIAAGCPVVCKPASKTPLSALALAAILRDVGLPPGGLSVLPCSRALGQRLVEDPRFAALTFTGSSEVGWQLRRDAGKKRVLLELGGNAAAIVLPDVVSAPPGADLEFAAERCAHGAFYQAGQSCISVQRVLAHAEVYERFRDALVARAEATPTGDPRDRATVCGPVIDDASAERLDRWIREALARGARLLTGGRREGRLLSPTILEGVPRDCELQREEAFGPVVCLDRAASVDEALEAAADTRFGLQCGLFTNDWRAIRAAWERIEVGGLVVGDAPAFRVDLMPYGGVRDSGLGREGPAYAVRELSEARLLVLPG
jgi:acyl-CoA reductase-like NAD-dependent aldehyde dehydrogenase